MGRRENMGKRKKLLLVLAVCCVLCGCRNGEGKDTDITTEAGTGVLTETDHADEQEIVSIADSEYAIKNCPVAGNSGLYEVQLVMPEAELWLVDWTARDEIVYAIYEKYEMSDTKTYLYAINPLQMEVLAQTKLPEGMYYENAITVSDSGEIIIYNCGNEEIYFLNDRLEEDKTLVIDDAQADKLVFSEDLIYGYYMDSVTGNVWRIDMNDGNKTCLFEDIPMDEYGYGSVCGLLGDEWLAFNYYDFTKEETTYEVRNIETGEIVYQSPDALYDMQGESAHYILRHHEDGMDEIICGNDSDSPNVLMLRNYKEYENIHVDWQNQVALSSTMVRDVENKQFKVSFEQYCLDTGVLQHASDYYIPYMQDGVASDENMLSAEGGYLSIGDMICLGDTGYILISAFGEKSYLYVWDLQEKDSQTGDEASYFRNWQNPEEPDVEALEEIRVHADEIGAKYDVEIYFGDEVKDCYKDIYDYEVTNNAIRIEQALNVLDEELALYPDGMLAQLDDDYGSRLKIYLAGKIVAADETALTTSVGIQNTVEDNTFMVLDILSIYDYEKTIHHELFHAIECHLNNEGYYFDYDAWMALNPDDFDYDYDYVENESNSDWTYVAGDSEFGGYFIDVYSKSFPHEDRARIMEYAVMEPQLQTGYFESEPLRDKLQYICDKIRDGFDTTDWPEQTIWEQCLYD